MTNRQDEQPDNKVDRVVDKYDLGDLGRELERRWTGDGRERQSLRDLAHYFNRRVLESAMDEAGVVTLQGELENIYDLLTGDDVTEGARTQARNRLEREGIDVDDLQNDFVSHYAVHTYLRDHRDAEYEAGDDDNQREKSVETIQRLTSRLSAVTRRNVENLRSTDRLDIGPVDVIADVQVVCQECGRQEDPLELIERGGCRCRVEE
ncbi:rod-determining factor RdfA [Halosimplex salinum]|uniref:rod-determining factor RdfA n=1 Tax=Halosimplex salinum TaxID=1710538 RepID=UPI000F48B9BB|nr:rod-determining factor RdfA [Halosimplex salinum]